MLNLNNLRTPGVYIDEVPVLPPSVAGVATGVPAFIGYTQQAIGDDGEDLTLVPTRISSVLEYTTYFGGPNPEDNGISVSITDVFPEDTAAAEPVSRVIKAEITEADRTPYNMYYSIQLYFANGGGPCYIVSVGGYVGAETIAATALQDGIDRLESEDEPTIIVIPENIHLTGGDYAGLYKSSMDQANKLKDRFVLLDVLMTAANTSAGINTDITTFRDATTTNLGDNLRFGAAYYPYLQTTIDFNYSGNESTIMISHSRTLADGSAVTNPTSPDYNGQALSALNDAANPLFNNLVYEQIKQVLTRIPLTLPSSPAVAGIYSKVDAERGVFKAPANVTVGAVVAPARKIDNSIQDNMNIDPTGGKSINAIRAITGRGILVWGARTLAGNDNEWRYISTRRFFNFVEESVQKATMQFVFEPNDANTWVRIKAMIENFLTSQWSQGALQGSKPNQAFFVKVGLGETMTAQDILEGRMIVEIGMAVVRPAEFIVLRFMQMLPQA
ncbi:MAG: phage tail sheath C-terminal domain-containing protein [Bacteroidota bacterium]